jgi:putative transposase
MNYRKSLIDNDDENDHDLSIKRRCELLSIPLSSYYYQPIGISQENIKLMTLIDEFYTKYPFYGKRRIHQYLLKHPDVSEPVNIKRISRLMKIMGLEAIYSKPNTSKSDNTVKKYPYLLHGIEINKANQVWASDITYIRMSRGFVYLTAVIDWYSRYVLSWEVSTSMDVLFCLNVLNSAIAKFGKPDIFNTDQGSQYTSQEFTTSLLNNDIKISRDGRRRFLDNIMVERLWRSVKYEEVYLHSYDTVAEAKNGLDKYFLFYNTERQHQAFDYLTPYQFYNENLLVAKGRIQGQDTSF